MGRERFVKAGGKLIAARAIVDVDISRVEQWQVDITYRDAAGEVQTARADGLDAVETVMLLKPSALEGLRMVWPRLGWVGHNLIGHPLVAVLDVLGTLLRPFGWHRPVYRWAIDIHDMTTPRPRGMKT